MEKIGIGITTYNRDRILKSTIEKIKKFTNSPYKLVIVDDGSTTLFKDANYRFNKNQGAPIAKNKCIELLEGCEHIFLFDDDTYPIKEGWETAYINANVTHLNYTFKYAFNVVDGVRHLENPNGCMMYINRKVLDTIGGFDTGFIKYGYWHGSFSNRVYNAGLIPYPFMDIIDSKEYIYCLDQQPKQHTTSRTDRSKYLRQNKQRYFQKLNSKEYINYKDIKIWYSNPYSTSKNIGKALNDFCSLIRLSFTLNISIGSSTKLGHIPHSLARKEAELAVENAAKEIENYKEGFEKQLENRQFLSQQVAETKKKELDDLKAKEDAFALLQLEKGIIDQNEYDKRINEIKEANRLAKKEIDTEREATEKEEAEELRALEFEAELERLLEEGATRFEVQQAQNNEQFKLQKLALDESLRNQEISQELYTARLGKLQADRTKAEITNEQILAEEKLSLATGLLDSAAKIIDKDSKAGKAIALAKAGINMYQGISAGLTVPPPGNYSAVAFAAATGLKAIKDIVSTKLPSASGSGSIGGGGGGFSANLATNLSGQGISLDSSSNANIQDNVENQANLNNMTEQMADAVQQGAQAGTQQGSQEGITNLSANQNIMQQSSF